MKTTKKREAKTEILRKRLPWRERKNHPGSKAWAGSIREYKTEQKSNGWGVVVKMFPTSVEVTQGPFDEENMAKRKAEEMEAIIYTPGEY